MRRVQLSQSLRSCEGCSCRRAFVHAKGAVSVITAVVHAKGAVSVITAFVHAKSAVSVIAALVHAKGAIIFSHIVSVRSCF